MEFISLGFVFFTRKNLQLLVGSRNEVAQPAFSLVERFRMYLISTTSLEECRSIVAFMSHPSLLYSGVQQ